MLNPNDVTKKSNTQSEETKNVIKDFPTDKKTIKEELKDFADSRMNSSIISDTHTRSTYLISDSTLEKLNNLVAFTEVSNGLDSELTKGMSREEINKGRVLSKGVKSKLVNYSIQKFLDDYESQEGLIPETLHKKYKVGNVYHNAYLFTQSGITYGVVQDNRGREIEFMSTQNGYTSEQINDWFDEIQDESVKTGRPTARNSRYV